jgi:hypothetical protein
MESTMAPPPPYSSTSSCSTITDKVLGKWCEVKNGFILQYYYDLIQQNDKNTNVPGIESAAKQEKSGEFDMHAAFLACIHSTQYIDI